MDSVGKLKTIWDQIQANVSQQPEFSMEEILRKTSEILHIGECFYIVFNTLTAHIEYTCPRLKKVLGYNPEEFTLDMLVEKVHPEDLDYFYQYEQSAVHFYAQLPKDLLYKYKFSYDYRLKTKKGSYKRILQQTAPFYFIPGGGAKTLVIITDITHFNLDKTPKLSFIGMDGAPSYYNVHQKKEFRLAKKLFTKRENEVLQQLIEGLTSHEIANKLNVSFSTVQTHRKNIMNKSGCNSVQTLLVKSIREGWV